MSLKKVLFAVFAILMVFVSCKKSSELSDAIPADANYVFHINTKSLIEKSEYDIFKNPMIQQGINMVKAMLTDEDKIKLLDDFLVNANSLGIDLKSDVFMYTNYQVYGMVFGVNDAAKFKDALIKLEMPREEMIKKEGNIYILSPDSRTCIAWDNNKLIILIDLTQSGVYNTPQTEIDVKALAKSQLKQGSDKSINLNKSFAEFLNNKKDISTFYSMEEFNKRFPLSFITGLPIDMSTLTKISTDMKGLSMGMYISFDNGEISMTYKTYFDTPDTEKKYREFVEKISGTLKGDHLKYIDSEPLFMATLNLKGDGIYNYLKDLGLAKVMNNKLPSNIEPQQIEQLAKGFSGDVTIGLMSVKKMENRSKPMPEILFFADVVSPQDTYNFIKKLYDDNEIPYSQLSSSVMMIEDSGAKVYLGVNDNTFFATNIESVYNNLNSTDLKNNYAGQIKDKMFLIKGDLHVLMPLLSNSHDLKQVIPFFNELGKYEMTSSATDLSGHGKLELDTKDKNSLAVICQHIDKLITNLSSSLPF